mmetsp:Transcript_74226/g.118219  ORF Transcript_74226/g.118219 Transcript_74226/m.118219 type:complete len:200 (-) Transcript_74226:407-1006(-)
MPIDFTVARSSAVPVHVHHHNHALIAHLAVLHIDTRQNIAHSPHIIARLHGRRMHNLGHSKLGKLQNHLKRHQNELHALQHCVVLLLQMILCCLALQLALAGTPAIDLAFARDTAARRHSVFRIFTGFTRTRRVFVDTRFLFVAASHSLLLLIADHVGCHENGVFLLLWNSQIVLVEYHVTHFRVLQVGDCCALDVEHR